MSRTLRSVVAFALVSLFVSAAFAQPRPSHSNPARSIGVWEWLIGRFAPSGSTVGTSVREIVAKAGSRMDSDGTALATPISSSSTSDAGSQMDPNGTK
jgi:hypothetical protein